MFKYYVAVASILLIAGCGAHATGPLFSEMVAPKPKMGTLYIYREDSIFVHTPTIKINNKPFVVLTKNGYTYMYLPPGIHRLTFDYGYADSPFITEILINEGGESFKKYSDNGARKKLTDVDKVSALAELTAYRFVEPMGSYFVK